MEFLSPQSERLASLVDHIAGAGYPDQGAWSDWQFTRVNGGMNGLLYRARRGRDDIAVKYTRRDARDRAGREYEALALLQQLGLDLAPIPVLLDRERTPHPIVAHAWLSGDVLDSAPDTPGEWRLLMAHLAAIHTVTPTRSPVSLRPAVVCLRTVADAKARLHLDDARFPPSERPRALHALVERADLLAIPDWPAPPLALCRCDPSVRNFIRRPTEWRSVDWENSGWGDPAFELGDLMAHPTYTSVPPSAWPGVIEGYAAVRDDPTLPLRIRTYRVLTLVGWAVAFARVGREALAGMQQQRLVERPANWHADVVTKYAHYLAVADEALATFSG